MSKLTVTLPLREYEELRDMKDSVNERITQIENQYVLNLKRCVKENRDLKLANEQLTKDKEWLISMHHDKKPWYKFW